MVVHRKWHFALLLVLRCIAVRNEKERFSFHRVAASKAGSALLIVGSFIFSNRSTFPVTQLLVSIRSWNCFRSTGVPRSMRLELYLLIVLVVCETFAKRLRRQGISFGGIPSSGEPCINPENKSGHCIQLSTCEAYSQRAKLLTRENANFLRSATCGYDRFDPFVCCPRNGLKIVTNPPTRFSPSPSPPPITNPPITRPPITRPPSTPPVIPPSETPQPTQVKCGIGGFTITRVVGGQNASLADWPWAVAIFMDDVNGVEQLACGGALVTNQHILTAAHCTMDKAGRHHPVRAFRIRLGDLDLFSDADGSEPIEIRVTSVTPHKEFNPSNFHNDIAIMKLASPVTFNRFIQPLCLPLEKDLSSDFQGTLATLVGWGTVGFNEAASPVLQYVMLPVQSQEVCLRSYRPFRNTHPIIKSQMCAGFMKGGKDACQGDSGGPLMWLDETRDDGPWIAVGVVSYGLRCAEPGFPGIYTRVTAFINWIHEHISQ